MEQTFTEFYECLNGITIKKGEDILSKLKLQDIATTAKFQTLMIGIMVLETFIQSMIMTC